MARSSCLAASAIDSTLRPQPTFWRTKSSGARVMSSHRMFAGSFLLTETRSTPPLLGGPQQTLTLVVMDDVALGHHAVPEGVVEVDREHLRLPHALERS